MAKYHRKVKPTESFEVKLEGEIFSVLLRKLNITEILQLEREGSRIMKGIAEGGGSLAPEAHTALVETICGLVVGIAGLEDEEGSELVWEGLREDERLDLFASVSVDSLTSLFMRASEVGRLSEIEKKA